MSAPPPIAISLALVKAQAAVDCARKDGINGEDQYSYATSDELVRVGKAAMAAHGLALLPMRYTVVAGEGGADLVRDVSLIHESGQCWTWQVRWPIPSGKARDKALASALTSLLGYTYRDLMGIPRVMFGEEPMDVRRERTAEPVDDEPAAERKSVLARKNPGDRHNNGKRPPYMPVEKPKKSAEEQAEALAAIEAFDGSIAHECEVVGCTGDHSLEEEGSEPETTETTNAGAAPLSAAGETHESEVRVGPRDGGPRIHPAPPERESDLSRGGREDREHALGRSSGLTTDRVPAGAQEAALPPLSPAAPVGAPRKPPMTAADLPIEVVRGVLRAVSTPEQIAALDALESMPGTDEEVEAFEREAGPAPPLDPAFVKRTTAAIIKRIRPDASASEAEETPRERYARAFVVLSGVVSAARRTSGPNGDAAKAHADVARAALKADHPAFMCPDCRDPLPAEDMDEPGAVFSCPACDTACVATDDYVHVAALLVGARMEHVPSKLVGVVEAINEVHPRQVLVTWDAKVNGETHGDVVNADELRAVDEVEDAMRADAAAVSERAMLRPEERADLLSAVAATETVRPESDTSRALAAVAAAEPKADHRSKARHRWFQKVPACAGKQVEAAAPAVEVQAPASAPGGSGDW